MSVPTAEKATPRVSERGRRVPASPIRKLASYADAAKKRGVKVYHLNIGQPDLETPAPMRERLSQIHDKVYAYTPSNGTPECLDFLVGYYKGRGIELTKSQVITTTGGSEAIQFAFMACCETGDQVLLVEPFYTNYRAFAAMGGIELTPIVTRAEDGFHLPAREEWEKAMTPRTRAVLLCNPNNPTGTVYSKEEVVRVAEFCRDHGLFLIADEVYREFVYDGREITSALSLPGYEDVVVVVDSLSKRYSACGIRLGCLVTRNPEVYQACLHMAQGRLSPPGLAQAIAPGAALLGPEYVKGVVTEYEKRRDILFTELTKIPGIFFRKPEGAFYFVARIPVKNSEDFAQWLLTDFQLDGATVMVAPADGFYATPGLGKDEVRIAYVLKAEDLTAACRVLEAAIPTYRAARGL